jgi:hypothetical protein
MDGGLDVGAALAREVAEHLADLTRGVHAVAFAAPGRAQLTGRLPVVPRLVAGAADRVPGSHAATGSGRCPNASR